MEKTVGLALLLLLTLLITTRRFADGQAFCRSQISLANEACSMRNYGGTRPYVPRQLLNESSTTATQGSSRAYELRSRNDDHDEEGRGEHEGRHRRRQRHRHSADSSVMDPRDTACCRRLRDMDNACICQAAARLPLFMTSVWHVIRLTPVEDCEVSFECPGSTSPIG